MKKTIFILLAATLVSQVSWAADPIIDLNAIDPTVNPCQDFYHYACGNWIKNFKLPADRSSYNRQSDGLFDQNEKQRRDILESYAKGNFTQVPSPYARKLGAFYSSCMNTGAIEKEASGFIRDQFKSIDQIQSSKDLASRVARLQIEGVDAFFGFGSANDLDDSSKMIGELDQGGMSFQDRGYYFNTDAKSVEILKHFTTDVSQLFQDAGESAGQAQSDAGKVLAFETHLAQKALAIEDMQDATKLHHPMEEAGLQALAPDFDWSTYFGEIGVDSNQKLNVTNPDFFKALSGILKDTPVQTVKIYLKWQILNRYASSLSKNFRNDYFSFWGQYLAGQKEMPPRWKVCVSATGSAMRDALAEAYVDSFPDASQLKARAETMIGQIKAAFSRDLNQLSWLDSATRAAAQLKLSKVTDKVGYPDHWRNFDNLKVDSSSYLKNVISSSEFASKIDLAKIGKATDRSLWDMPPWEINAYYNPPSNEMVFPIATLVPPILDLSASMGANFGSIGGGWMGHELTHGFDSDGHHFDGDGNLKNWWTPTTAQEFDHRTQCLVDQADQYEVLPGLKVNGKQTLTENLADQGGVKMGYLAYEALTAGEKPAPNVGSFNERQQYWVAYAQSWCTKQTEASLRLQMATDVHPPAEFRTNAVLMNRPEFAQDFGCAAGSRMAPVQRCSVW